MGGRRSVRRREESRIGSEEVIYRKGSMEGIGQRIKEKSGSTGDIMDL